MLEDDRRLTVFDKALISLHYYSVLGRHQGSEVMPEISYLLAVTV